MSTLGMSGPTCSCAFRPGLRSPGERGSRRALPPGQGPESGGPEMITHVASSSNTFRMHCRVGESSVVT
eukprot:562848-Pyramimonas_sp.AAC.1